MASSTAIAPLPLEVVAQIKSSVCITSLNGVIVGLLKNSLDASAEKIDIQVNYGRGFCVIEDDGHGIPPAEFQPSGGLAKLHHTSKRSGSTETHGTHGCFLASLAALSLLSITSHHHLHHSHNSMTLSRSHVVTRQTPAPEQQRLTSLNHGTRVVVHNLFGDMPVRVKQRAIESAEPSSSSKDWDFLRKDIAGLVLAWPGSVSITVKEFVPSARLRTLRISSRLKHVNEDSALITHICSVLAKASFITSADTSSWICAGGSTSTVSIRSGISLDPAPTKNIQFISFGIHPLSNEDGRNILFEEINRLFANSSFGKVDDLPQLDDTEMKRRAEDRRYKGDGFTIKELKGSGKGVDRWPVFYIRIDMHGPFSHQGAVDDVFDDEKTLTSIMKLLQAVIVEFLRSNNFTPKLIRPASPSKQKRGSIKIEPNVVDSSSSMSRSIGDIARTHPQGTSSIDKSFTPHADVSSPRTTKFPRSTTPRPASPFDIWPRVKSGRAPAASGVSKFDISNVDGKARTDTGDQPEGYTGKEQGGRDTAKVSPKPERPESRNPTPIVSKSGIVSRLPFLDVARPSKRPAATSNVNIPKDEPAPSDIEKDELVPWTDPATKKSCFINKRTGLIEHKMKPHREINDYTSMTGGRVSTFPGKYRRTAGHEGLSKSPQQPSDWLNGILSSWNNPVFRPAETSIPRVPVDWGDTETQSILHGHGHNCSQMDIDRAFQNCAVGAIGQLTKDGLRRAEVIAQIDRKFILVKMPSATRGVGSAGADVLVIVDQHAADERCRIEQLMAEFLAPPPLDHRPLAPDAVLPGVQTARLEKPMKFEVAQQESERLELHKRHFADWGILYHIRPANPMRGMNQDQVNITSLPDGIVERCKADPKLVIDLVRKELWEYDGRQAGSKSSRVKLEAGDEGMAGGQDGEEHAWLRRIHGCPRGILEMLNSRACRSAVMFNDELSREECEALMQRLGGCAFPFQCAHGRPSMVPLVDVGGLGRKTAMVGGDYGEPDDFRGALRRWRGRMGR